MAAVVEPKQVEAQVVAVATAAGPPMDYVAFANLANLDHFHFSQMGLFGELVSSGCMANRYVIKPKDQDQAVFVMHEESSIWCRACCSPAQPALVKFYNATAPQTNPDYCFGKCKGKNTYGEVNAQNGAILTFEKNGNCGNCAQMGPTNCWVCHEKCQSKAYYHIGDVPSTLEPKGCGPCKCEHWEFPNGAPGLPETARPNMFARAEVPVGGGGCTPTINLMVRDQNGGESQFAVVEGPTFFGGCMDLCCTTTFMISREAGKSGDLAKISKLKPEGIADLCIALVTPVDYYDIDFAEGHGLHPTEKAAILGEVVHLDFLFFEAEQPLCRYEDESGICYILLCTCYCFGCLCPVQLCIMNPEKAKP